MSGYLPRVDTKPWRVILTNAQGSYMYNTRHKFLHVPRNAVEFFLLKHCGNQKVSVPLMSHLCPQWNTVVNTVGHFGIHHGTLWKPLWISSYLKVLIFYIIRKYWRRVNFKNFVFSVYSASHKERFYKHWRDPDSPRGCGRRGVEVWTLKVSHRSMNT